MIRSLLLHSRRVGWSLLNRLGLRVRYIRIMVNIAVWIASLCVHHHLRLGGLYAVVLGTVFSHNRHSDRRLVGKMVGVSRACTAGTIGRELMDTRYSAGEVTSERREIHCRPEMEFMYLESRKTYERVDFSESTKNSRLFHCSFLERSASGCTSSDKFFVLRTRKRAERPSPILRHLDSLALLPDLTYVKTRWRQYG